VTHRRTEKAGNVTMVKFVATVIGLLIFIIAGMFWWEGREDPQDDTLRLVDQSGHGNNLRPCSDTENISLGCRVERPDLELSESVPPVLRGTGAKMVVRCPENVSTFQTDGGTVEGKCTIAAHDSGGLCASFDGGKTWWLVPQPAAKCVGAI
jgi:hypothetical protein